MYPEKEVDNCFKMAEKRFLQLFEMVPVSYCLSDTKGVIQALNPSALKMLKVKQADMIGSRLCELFPPLEQTRYKQILQDLLHSQKEQQMDSMVTTSEGKTVYINVCSTLLTAEVLEEQQILTALTERKQPSIGKHRTESSQAVLERLVLLGSLMANTASEIRQPLHALKMMTDGILYWHQRGKSPSMETLYSHFNTISRHAERIDSMLHRMNAFLNRRHWEQPGLIHVNSVVEGALALIGHQLESRGILIRKELCPSKAQIAADYGRMEEAVMNILLNSMQAVDNLHIHKKEIRIVTGCTASHATLEITNSGPPIPPELADKIFDPFFTTQNTGKAKEGLGLAVAQCIVKDYQGSISFHNRSEGVSFYIKLPVYVS